MKIYIQGRLPPVLFLERSSSADDEARIVEQWSMDFVNRAGWDKIVEDTLAPLYHPS